ncbi:hypothetical protein C1N53_01720 [Pontibacter sp. SGAir0037]|nr:hypothetical protein C1N53_01720 [Pontibacter sp. SGAir0037]
MLVGITTHAQSNREKIESAKVAFLTDKLALTPDQAQKFWPLYKEYEGKRREIVYARLNKGKDLENLSDQDLRAMVDNMFDRRQKELNLEQEYAAKFQRVLSAKQMVLLYRGEHEFTKLLLQKLDNRQSQ